MEEEDKLMLTSAMLNSCRTPAEIVDLPAVQDRWVRTYEMTTGRKDGDLRFHAEKTMFMQTVAEDRNLAACTPMSVYSSFILLAVSGLSLKDGESYLIPYGKKCTWMPGWKGRLEQITQIPGVKQLTEPLCVYANEEDDFEYEINNGKYVITRHKPKLNTEGQDIILVYANLIMQDGTSTVYMMKREEVISIRDRYSQSYNQYIANEPNAQGKRVRKYKDKFTGEWKEFELDPPMWVTDEAQAFKKTLVKRIYNTIPKSGTIAYLDNEIQKAAQDADEYGEMDAEDMARNVEDIAGVEECDYEVVEDDVQEEEVKQAPVAEKPKATPKPKATAKKQEVKPTVVEEDDDETF